VDRLSFFIGLVALAVSLFSGHIGKSCELPIWLGIICLSWGGLALLRAYVTPLSIVWNLIHGRFPLRIILGIASTQFPAVDKRKLLNRVLNLARSGQVTIYGEHGSSKHVVAIPADHFKTHDLIDGLEEMRTFDPAKNFSDQDSDDLHFNLYARKSLLRKILNRLSSKA
jgi:hypothetical protein